MHPFFARELSQYTFERDQQEFNFGDILDVKAGLLWAILAFLATQSGELIKLKLSLFQVIAQTVSMIALAFGGVFSVIVLWPRGYKKDAKPAEYEEWIVKTDEFQRAHPAVPVQTLSAARLAAAKQRIEHNSNINKTKSKWMFRAFFCVVLAFASNLVTLLMRLS